MPTSTVQNDGLKLWRRRAKLAGQALYSILFAPLLSLTVKFFPRVHMILCKPLVSGPFHGKLVDDIFQTLYQYERSSLDEEQFITAVNKRMCEAVHSGEIDDYLNTPVFAGQNLDITLSRCLGYAPLRWWYLKLHFMAEDNIHGLHAHRNVLSTQVIARGSLAVQEYDLVGSLDDSPTRLKLRRDEEVGPVSGFISTDRVANVHGFRPVQTPAVRFQFYLRGHTGLIKMLTPKRGRLYVHPLGAPDENGILMASIGESGKAGES